MTFQKLASQVKQEQKEIDTFIKLRDLFLKFEDHKNFPTLKLILLNVYLTIVDNYIVLKNRAFDIVHYWLTLPDETVIKVIDNLAPSFIEELTDLSAGTGDVWHREKISYVICDYFNLR